MLQPYHSWAAGSCHRELGLHSCGTRHGIRGGCTIFDLRAHHLDRCKLVYDRAALIAMEQHDRPRYYEHMLSILPAGCNMLLITLQYDQAEMRGPPFSVPTDEVMRRYEAALTIEILDSEDIIDERPRWRKVGLTALQETVFSLNPC